MLEYQNEQPQRGGMCPEKCAPTNASPSGATGVPLKKINAINSTHLCHYACLTHTLYHYDIHCHCGRYTFLYLPINISDYPPRISSEGPLCLPIVTATDRYM